MEMVIRCDFLFSKAGNFETSITRVPYNKLLTNLAYSSRTGEYWPSRSVSKRLVLQTSVGLF